MLVTPVLEARGLTKRFGRIQALTGLDLVKEGGRMRWTSTVLKTNARGRG